MASIHKSLYSKQTSFIRHGVCKVGVVGAADVVGVVDAVAVDMVGAVGAADAADGWMQ